MNPNEPSHGALIVVNRDVWSWDGEQWRPEPDFPLEAMGLVAVDLPACVTQAMLGIPRALTG